MLFAAPVSCRFLRFYQVLFAVLLALSAAAQGQTPAPAGVLVSGAGLTQAARVSPAQLAQLPRLEVVRAGHDGKPHTYSGVALYAVLTAAGPNLSPAKLPGKGLAHFLQVSAADGYQAVFALAELNPDFAPRTVLLADRCDGQPLPTAAGPYQIIVPEEKKMGRCVRQVQTLHLVATQP